MPMPTLAGQHEYPRSTDQPPATRTPATRTPATRTPATRPSGGHTATGHTPANRTPAGRTSANRTPANQRTRWGRFLRTVLPQPAPDRLVVITDVPRAMLGFVEDCLADVDVTAVVQEVPAFTGDSRFRVLVSARDRELATEVLTGI